jgi:hypothetical protein
VGIGGGAFWATSGVAAAPGPGVGPLTEQAPTNRTPMPQMATDKARFIVNSPDPIESLWLAFDHKASRRKHRRCRAARAALGEIPLYRRQP